ncbi:MAG: glycosyltransferase [Pseudolabrys sp.]|nr:glycosyltransferase [Pseudolabrys sp.]MDP2295736.1 glycosyltransferase [Pseudolabrys sp.]
MLQLTLITSVLNGMPFLGEMLASIPADARVEHLVIDAGSTDGSLELAGANPRLHVASRPGLPLYDAWNEGVAMASGRFVWFVNADDRLGPGALARALTAIEQNKGADVIAGNANAFVATEDAGEVIRWHYAGIPLAGLTLASLLFGAPLINAKLFHRDLFATLGSFDTSYAFAADREFLLRLLQRQPPAVCRHLDALLYRYRIHGGSKTLQPNPARRVEISLEHRRIALALLRHATPGTASRELLQAWLAHEQAVTALRGALSGKAGEASAAACAFAVTPHRSINRLMLARHARRDYRAALLRAAPAPHAEPSR